MASKTVSASEVQKNFGAYHDQALVEPVRVTKYGRETVYLISAAMYHALKQGQRQSISAQDLGDDESALIAKSEIPAARRFRTKDLG